MKNSRNIGIPNFNPEIQKLAKLFEIYDFGSQKESVLKETKNLYPTPMTTVDKFPLRVKLLPLDLIICTYLCSYTFNLSEIRKKYNNNNKMQQ